MQNISVLWGLMTVKYSSVVGVNVSFRLMDVVITFIFKIVEHRASFDDSYDFQLGTFSNAQYYFEKIISTHIYFWVAKARVLTLHSLTFVFCDVLICYTFL